MPKQITREEELAALRAEGHKIKQALDTATGLPRAKGRTPPVRGRVFMIEELFKDLWTLLEKNVTGPQEEKETDSEDDDDD